MGQLHTCENCKRPVREESPMGRLCNRCVAELGIEDDVARDVGLDEEAEARLPGKRLSDR